MSQYNVVTKPKEKGLLRESIELIAVALALAIIIRTFVFNCAWVSSGSMIPTLMVQDRIIATKFSYWFQKPQRGDVVVFEYPLDPNQTYVKRLIGLPGETIQFKDSELYVDGKRIDEPYLPEVLEFADYGPVVVPDGQYFMVGDNRNNSLDSRSWGFVHQEFIIGKGQVIYWPLDRITTLR